MIQTRVGSAVTDKLDVHILKCPVKLLVEINEDRIKAIESWPKQAKLFSKGFILGVIVVSSAVGSGITFVIVKVLKLFL